MTDAAGLTGIYLQDHHALLTGAEALARRIRRQTGDDEIRALVDETIPHLREDREAVGRVLRGLGREPSAVKDAAARIGERLGRLKLNGNARGYSPLSRLLELEGLWLALAADRALWRTVERAGPETARADAADRATRLEARLERVEALRLGASEVALGGGTRRL